MPIHKTEAIVLKKFDFRETSLIVHFYTKDHGRISGLLKGIRSQPQKFASSLEQFSHNEIIFYKKSSTSLHLVSAADLRNNFFGIRNSVSRLTSGSIILELLHALCPEEDANRQIFDLSLEALKELETNYDTEKIATFFKIKILALSGFKPHFDSCVSCSDKISGQAKFSVSLGGLLCGRCQHKDLTSRQIFRGTTATILYIENNHFRNILNLGLNPQIKKELDFVLNSFLNFHLGKKLKSEACREAI